jgi:hypothetical protein
MWTVESFNLKKIPEIPPQFKFVVQNGQIAYKRTGGIFTAPATGVAN